MKPLYSILLLLFMPLCSIAQFTFWTEDFGPGCSNANPAAGYVGQNGIWTVTDLGTVGDTPNEWYVSATENGNAAGECGSGCGSDRSLHLGSTALGDIGAAYYDCTGILCNFFGTGATDKRVESPIIDCASFSDVTVNFVYIEGGNNIDNATMWYFDGSTWSLLIDLAKTATGCPDGQGTWTDFSIVLPASANTNPQVRIGFRWTNNDDGIATDPSVAIDDISIEGTFADDDVTPPELICPGDMTIELLQEFGCLGFLGDFTDDAFVTDNSDPFPMLEQDPEASEIISGPTLVTLTATDLSGNSTSCSFMVTIEDNEAPILECPVDIFVTAAPGETEASVNVPLPDVSDCSAYTLVNDQNGTDDASGIYPIGTTTVAYEATDESGNFSQCTFSVTVEENTNTVCCYGDFNCDGVVSVDDLIILVTQFGCTNGCTADLDEDLIIGISDMQIFTSLYGNICP